MVSNSCKIAVKEELRKLNLRSVVIKLGEVEIKGNLLLEDKQKLNKSLSAYGLELMEDKKYILVEKIKNCIIDMVHYSNEKIKINFSNYLSEKLNHNYTYMANIFSVTQGLTIEQFIISHKIERIKELIIYGELNISEIAQKLHYSSVAHLSNQFKKLTGISPSCFKRQTVRQRSPIENLGAPGYLAT
ncbi:AraC family transcriptional regulator [Flavobacterium sp. SM15]|uniref:AraC family transcriptional regulator n=1 Tax=Flavobacterium sp. SM15 TaxID=2908005 RepID=UPI001EDA1FB9|nr:AraC family transcriptional regulator [Flavobacterium sp. SM15]MCG2609998.1 AraC family transcriptional regulator [Flavobacterium sp. SM15]